MSSGKKDTPDGVNWQLVAEATLHPVQVAVINHLATKVNSPGKMARVFGEPLGNAAYHVRALKKAGLLVVDHEVRRRGAVEHFYRLADGVVA